MCCLLARLGHLVKPSILNAQSLCFVQSQIAELAGQLGAIVQRRGPNLEAGHRHAKPVEINLKQRFRCDEREIGLVISCKMGPLSAPIGSCTDCLLHPEPNSTRRRLEEAFTWVAHHFIYPDVRTGERIAVSREKSGACKPLHTLLRLIVPRMHG